MYFIWMNISVCRKDIQPVFHIFAETLFDYVKVKFLPGSRKSQNSSEDMLAYEKLLRENPADLCALGIGENGHIALMIHLC